MDNRHFGGPRPLPGFRPSFGDLEFSAAEINELLKQLVKMQDVEGLVSGVNIVNIENHELLQPGNLTLEDLGAARLENMNDVFVPWQGSAYATRNYLPALLRRKGISISYVTDKGIAVKERAVSDVGIDNANWGIDSNWMRVDELSLNGKLYVSPNGTWVINGVDTGIQALGPKGDNGLTPRLKTIDNKLHYSYDGNTWLDAGGEHIAAWFRWSGNKIQISRDNKTWEDFSGEFADNLFIKGYVATFDKLPADAVQGDIWGVGPRYAAEDTEQTQPIYRYWVRNADGWVDNGEFTSIVAGIVQETGDGEGVVMSQKAVTEIKADGNYTNLVSLGSISLPIEFNGTAHSSNNDKLYVRIPSNTKIKIRIIDENELQPSGTYALYFSSEGGSSDFIEIKNVNTDYNLIKDYDIISFGIYKAATVQGSVILQISVDNSLNEKIDSVENSLNQKTDMNSDEVVFLKKTTLGIISKDYTLQSASHSSTTDKMLVNIAANESIKIKFVCDEKVSSTRVGIYFRDKDGKSVDELTISINTEHTYVAINDIHSIGVYFEGEVGGKAQLIVDIDNESISDIAKANRNKLSSIEGINTDKSSRTVIVSPNSNHSSMSDLLFFNADIGDRITISLSVDGDLVNDVAIYAYGDESVLLGTLSPFVGNVRKAYVLTIPIKYIGLYYSNPTNSAITFNYTVTKINRAEYDSVTFNYDGNEHSSSLDQILFRIKNNTLKVRVSSNHTEIPAMQMYINSQASPTTINSVGITDIILPSTYNSVDEVRIGIYIAGGHQEQKIVLELYTSGSPIVDYEAIKDDDFGQYFNNTNEVESYLYFTDPHTLTRATNKHYFDNHIRVINNIADGNPINFVMCGGDWLNNLDTQKEACSKLGYIRAAMLSFNVPGYNVVGNHDYNYLGRLNESSELGTGNLSVETLGNLWFGKPKTYYDFLTPMSRFYVIDTGIDSSHVGAISLTDYEVEQCKWLCDSLYSNKDKNIVLSFHIYYVQESVPLFVQELINIASAYNSRGRYNLNGYVYDFSTSDGIIHCCICGHSHMDFNVINNGIPVIGTTIASDIYNDVSDEGMNVTLDLVLLDYTNKRFKSVRYGNGINRDIEIL